MENLNTDNAVLHDRNKIINFARDYYLKEGFYKTSMDTLASGMRISKKTIYRLFPSKELLVEEVVNIVMTEVQGSINKILVQKTDAISKIRMLHKILGLTLIRFSDKWLNDLKIHMPLLWEKIDEFRTGKMFAILSSIIEQGKKEGLIADKPNEILVTLFVASVRAIVNPDFLFYNKFSYQDAVDHTFDILFNGFLTREGEKTYKRKLKEKTL